ncbi:MAG TPA: hypothetical protein VMV77_18960 [Bacteroidales bacterium]|nr:hypothetical protein [Bacteroidales bacterium]
MNTEGLNRLLEKYYRGESTEEEEKTLSGFFQNNNIPEGYEAEKVIFGYYSEAAEVPEPSPGFEASIMAGIDEADRIKKKKNFRKYILPYFSAAAGLLILTASYFFFVHKSATMDTFSDPKLAYAETMKILMEVSTKLNRGTRALEPVSKMNEQTIKSFDAINKSTNIIEKNFKSFDYLQKALELSIGPEK